jgi:NADH:ubiquinone oxidoreductase subunit D
MEEMIQSSRMIEQALRELPDASLEAASGKILPAFQYADQAKRGRTGGLRSSRAAGDPTLEGSGRDRRPFILTPDKLVALPAKEEVYGNIEGLMNHFKLIMNGHGIRPPKGEVYFPVEGANGELGFYLVSDGTDRPCRVHCRPPCLAIMAALGEILRGELVADVVATFGTVNMIAGELER